MGGKFKTRWQPSWWRLSILRAIVLPLEWLDTLAVGHTFWSKLFWNKIFLMQFLFKQNVFLWTWYDHTWNEMKRFDLKATYSSYSLFLIFCNQDYLLYCWMIPSWIIPTKWSLVSYSYLQQPSREIGERVNMLSNQPGVYNLHFYFQKI